MTPVPGGASAARDTLGSNATIANHKTLGPSRPLEITAEVLHAAQAPAASAPVSSRYTSTEAKRRTSSYRRCSSRSRSSSSVSRVGAVLLGCQNVRRIAAAAREEFLLGDEAVFKSISGGTVRSALGALGSVVSNCRALSIDLILHIGGNDLAHR